MSGQTWRNVAAALACAPSALHAAPQASAPTGPTSLIVDPQAGATPSPVPRPAPATLSPPTTTTMPTPPAAALPARPLLPRVSPAPMLVSTAGQVRAGFAAPEMAERPMAIDPKTDPVLAYARSAGQPAAFRAAIVAAVERHPSREEALASEEEAQAARAEAVARMNPTVDLSVSYFNTVARDFSNDPLNLLERSRPRRRTDGILSVQQPLVDFGANRDRLRAATSRLEAAHAGVVDMDAQLALRAIVAWTAVFTNRVAVQMARALIEDQRGLRRALDTRVAQGYAAPADAAQLDGYIASGAAQLSELRRSLANAEAQYLEMVGAPPPEGLARIPEPTTDVLDITAARGAADDLPMVTAARALASAARRDAGSVRASTWPQLGVSITAGRYGVIETERDYDIRAAATLSWRLFGGAAQRVDQAEARAHSADARYRRTREEARRDAAIASADVDALLESEHAIAEDYLASRRARDAVASRFRVSRGTVFDVAIANSNYFGVAIRYLRTLGELDTARYALLARTNRLLDTLQITPDPAL